MPAPIPENTILLRCAEKHAIREALEGHPAHPQSDALLNLLGRVGDMDGEVSFTGEQSAFFTGTLVPWARENKPFRGPEPRGKMALMLLEAVSKRLRTPAPQQEIPAIPRHTQTEERDLFPISTCAAMTAELWANVETGDNVLIYGERVHAELAAAMEESCRSCGAASVTVHLTDPATDRDRIATLPVDELKTVDPDLKQKADAVANPNGVFIRIVGKEDPNYLDGLDSAKVNALETSRQTAFSKLLGTVSRGEMSRCVLPAPTVGWAAQLFPNLEPAMAFTHLQKVLASVCCLDAANAKEAFLAQDQALEAVRERLVALDVK